MNISDKQLTQIKKFLTKNGIVDLSQTTENTKSEKYFKICSPSSGVGKTLLISMQSEPGKPSFQENRHFISVFIRKFFKGYKLDIDILYGVMCPDEYIFPLDDVAHQKIIDW